MIGTSVLEREREIIKIRFFFSNVVKIFFSPPLHTVPLHPLFRRATSPSPKPFVRTQPAAISFLIPRAVYAYTRPCGCGTFCVLALANERFQPRDGGVRENGEGGSEGQTENRNDRSPRFHYYYYIILYYVPVCVRLPITII